MLNLASDSAMQSHVELLLQKLESVVDYKSVAKNVAKYGHDSLAYFVKRHGNWRQEMANKNLRWHESWSLNPAGAIAAIEDFLAKPPTLSKCRSEKVWPPAPGIQ